MGSKRTEGIEGGGKGEEGRGRKGKRREGKRQREQLSNAAVKYSTDTVSAGGRKEARE